MFRVYLFTFEGHLNIYFQNYSGKKNSASIQYLYGVNRDQKSLKKNAFITFMKQRLLCLFPFSLITLFVSKL
jgi:uncharacterized membrane protein YdjX (TVP38/TMEM64 family)